MDPNTSQLGEPVWQIARLFPPQGSWSVADYLSLDAGRLVEFDEGCIEVLELPTVEHQRIVQYLFRVLFQVVDAASLGEVFVAPLPVRIAKNKFREPEVVFLAADRDLSSGYPSGADLVIEVVSDDAQSRRRDLVTKLAEYRDAGIPEYWMIDPAEEKIQLATLRDGDYAVTAYQVGEIACSRRLPEFKLSVDAILASAKRSMP